MSLQMIYGRSGRGKTEKLFELLLKSLEKDNDIRKKRFVIVPDQFSYSMEKKIMEKFGMKNVFRIQIMGFSMLAQRILENAGGIKRKTIDPVGRSMLIKSLLREKGQDLSIYAGVSESPGFGDLAGKTIKEMKTYGKKPEDLMTAAEGIKEAETSSKLKDIAVLYSSYEEEIEGKFPDGEDRMNLAAEKFDSAGFLEGAEFFLDEFSDFTPLQMGMVAKMMKNHDTYITLTYDERFGHGTKGAFSLPADTDRRLMEEAQKGNVSIKKPITVDNKGRFISGELDFLEENLYSYSGKEYMGKAGDIRIVNAPSPRDELEFVAGDILKRVRDGGLRFRDIAVLMRNTEDYETDLKSVMDEAGIPVFVDRRKNILHNPLTSFVTSFFDIMTTNFSHDAVMRYLKSGLTPLDADTVSLTENYVMENGIKNNGWLKSYWEYPMRFRGNEQEMTRDLNLINEAREITAEPLERVFSELDKAETVRDMAEIFYNFLKEEGFLEKYELKMENFREKDPYVFSKYRQSADNLMDVLDQAVEIMGDKKITPAEFGKNITDGLLSVKIALIPATLDQVIVGDVSRVKSSSVKGIYIVGANDGVLPRRPEEDPVLNDGDRKAMAEAGLKIGGTSSERIYYEDFYLYNALSSAGSFLTVSYPLTGNKGETLRPSPVISKLKNLFRYLGEESTDNLSKDLPFTESYAFSRLTGEMKKYSSGREVAPIWKQVYGYFESKEDYREKLSAVMRGLKYDNSPGELKISNMEKLFGKNIPVTVSRAETYNKCPFSYFVKYGLNAKERKEHVVERFDDGNIMHGILDRMSKKLAQTGKNLEDADPQYISEAVESLMDETMADSENSVFTSTAQLRYRLEKLKRNLKSTIDIIGTQIRKGEFTPMGTEITFGRGGDLPGITLPLTDTHSVSISGIIDRADIMRGTAGDFVRIVDYKSSKRNLEISDILEGLQLQLLIYLSIILKNRESIIKDDDSEGKLIPAAVFYSFLGRPIINSDVPIDPEEIRMKMMAESKLEGLILDNKEIIISMDRDGDNLVTKFSINSSGEISRRNAKTLTEQDFSDLMEYSLKLIKNMAGRLLKGEIPVTPVKKGNIVQCTYCPYKSICRFDPTLPGNDFKIIKKRKPEEAMDEVRRRLKEGGNDE